jgi:hypothetical protein
MAKSILNKLSPINQEKNQKISANKLSLEDLNDIGKIANICREISLYTEDDAFFDYCPHVQNYSICIHEGGWTKKSIDRIIFNVYLPESTLQLEEKKIEMLKFLNSYISRNNNEQNKFIQNVKRTLKSSIAFFNKSKISVG